MYEDYYGLKEKPFSLTPDPHFLYLSKHHQGALDHILYGIRQREGFITIVGEVGTGKTTLCRCLMDRLEKNVQMALILNPMLSETDLLKTCIQDLNIRPSHIKHKNASPLPTATLTESGDESFIKDDLLSSWVNQLSKKELIDILNTFLLQQHDEGKFTVLIIDEAQNLSFEVLEQLRIISNLETEREKLIQIIFVGQMELNDKLNQEKMKQLNQRISIRYKITPLNKDETRNYINHRLMMAGANSRIFFSNSAINAIYNYSNGYPRLINLVADRTLLAGFNAQLDTLEGCHVKQGICSLLGSEDKSYLLTRFIKTKLTFAASLAFFLAGLTLFFLSSNGYNLEETMKLLQVTKPSIADSSLVTKQKEDLTTEDRKHKPITIKQSIPTQEKTYQIQVYSMTSTTSAKESVRLLEGEGYPAFWKESINGNKTWYLVYAGPYKTIGSANHDLRLLKDSGRNVTLLSHNRSS